MSTRWLTSLHINGKSQRVRESKQAQVCIDFCYLIWQRLVVHFPSNHLFEVFASSDCLSLLIVITMFSLFFLSLLGRKLILWFIPKCYFCVRRSRGYVLHFLVLPVYTFNYNAADIVSIEYIKDPSFNLKSSVSYVCKKELIKI